MLNKISPHIWLEKDVVQAAAFYTGLFPNSRLLDSVVLENTPSGDAQSVRFILHGQLFQAIAAGPVFKLNASISFMAVCKTVQEVERLHAELTPGGSELMELGEYPFSHRYAWLQDKYGLNWQLITLADEPEGIRPTLMFAGEVCGKAEEAAQFYTSLFPNSSMGYINRYEPDQLKSEIPKVSYMDFQLAGRTFCAMDHADINGDPFNEALSLIVYCEDQQEVDSYWEKLSAVPEAEACGWVKDQYGVSWQIIPIEMDDLLFAGTREQVARMIQAMLEMKKLDIAELKRAYMGE